MDGPAGSDKVQTGEAADQVMVVGAPAPQATVQLAADATQKKPRAKKRAAQDAMSPGHLASTTALSPVDRRQQHAVLGVDKAFRDKVKEAESSLDLTKDVRELQQVMRQVVAAIQGLENNDFDQEARMVLTVQRVEGLDPKILGLETADEQLKGSIKDMGNFLTDRLRDFEREIGGKDKVLYAALAAQEGILTERIEEIKATFSNAKTSLPRRTTAPQRLLLVLQDLVPRWP